MADMHLNPGTPVFIGLLLSLLCGTTCALAEPAAFHITPVTSAPVHTNEGELLLAKAMARIDERLAKYPDDPEGSLLKGILLFKMGRLAEAHDELERLTRREPGFHLAHLVHGDLLLARTHALRGIGDAVSSDASPQALGGLREEAEARLRAFLDSIPQDRVPSALLALDDEVRTAVVVDKASHRLYAYEYAGAAEPPRLVRDFYVSTGRVKGDKLERGDLRTPEGVYFVIEHIPASLLADKYGIAAYPINYPNELDVRLGKTGDGIWLHGTERASYSRPPFDSEGCVVLPNADLLALGGDLKPGVTPVVITERVQWLTREQWQRLRVEVFAAIESWRADWESGEVERYLAHYSPRFWSEGHDAQSWSALKRQEARETRKPQVLIRDVSAFAYPNTASDHREMVVINLRQEFRTDEFSSHVPKRLYLAREEGRWKVLYEGGR